MKFRKNNQFFLYEHVDFKRDAIQKGPTAPERNFHGNQQCMYS